MLGEVVCVEAGLAVGAVLHFVELFFVLFLEVDVIHLPAVLALLDVAPAVTEMGGYLGLGEVLEAVVATLERFVLHLKKESN